jgi:hypothetical protein
MLFADPSKARVVGVLDEIGRLLVEAKSLRDAMTLVTRTDAILERVARWVHQSPTPDEATDVERGARAPSGGGGVRGVVEIGATQLRGTRPHREELF